MNCARRFRRRWRDAVWLRHLPGVETPG